MARKGLGRGLDAILGDAPVQHEKPAPREGVKLLSLSDIHPDPEQPRKHFDDALLEELAASIKTQGLLQPILVRPSEDGKSYIIIAGERRWRASAKAGLHEIPALIRQADRLAIAEMALIENLQRSDLNPIEEAEAYAALKEKLNRSPADIAEAVGKSRSHIANMMRLTGLPDGVKDKVVSGGLSMGHARALLTATNPEALADLIVKMGLSVRDTEKLASGKTKSKKTTSLTADKTPAGAETTKLKDADTRSLESDLEAVLGLSVAIEHGKKGGHVTLTYDTLEQLDDICRRLMGTSI